MVDKIELTRVHEEFDGDAYFPEIPLDIFELINEEKFMKGAPKKAKKFASSEFSKEILAKRMGKLYGGNL